MQSLVFTGLTSLFVLLQPKTRQMEEPEDHPILEDLKSRIILCSKLGLTSSAGHLARVLQGLLSSSRTVGHSVSLSHW